jgi:protein-disulfide isomerase
VTALRHAFVTALALGGLAALVGISAPHAAMAQNAVAALLAKPMSLPDMALGEARAPITIVEFASMTCPHCAAFEQNVFPMVRSKYIDTGKVRYVFREFPLDIKAASAAVLARCIAAGNAEKFFGAIDTLFKQQDALMEHTRETLLSIGKQGGFDDNGVESCVGDQVAMDKLSADENFAAKQLKVDATPSFFINGTMVKGAMSFEEFEAKLKPLLKK